MNDLADHWLDLAPPWRGAIEQAWESFVLGNIGVGAVLTDPSGAVVAVGRNRVCDEDAPPGRLRSTYLAHAEVDVLGQMPRGDYQDHVLWTTLESCPFCAMASVMSSVGHVRFAARDLTWDDVSRLQALEDFVTDRWPRIEGPLRGPAAAFCQLLPLIWFETHKPGRRVSRRYDERAPAMAALARKVIGDPGFETLKRGSAEAALRALGADLVGVAEHANRGDAT